MMGFATLSEAVPVASDNQMKTAWWRKVNGPILSEESQDLNDVAYNLRVPVKSVIFPKARKRGIYIIALSDAPAFEQSL